MNDSIIEEARTYVDEFTLEMDSLLFFNGSYLSITLQEWRRCLKDVRELILYRISTTRDSSLPSMRSLIPYSRIPYKTSNKTMVLGYQHL